MKKNVHSALMQGLSYSLVFLVIRGTALYLNQYFDLTIFSEIVKYSELLFTSFFVAFLCYDIADKPGLAIGALVGALVYLYKTEIYGILIYGILTGYLIKYIKRYLNHLPQEFKYLSSLLWLPLLSLLIILPIIYFTSPYLSKFYIETVKVLKEIENYQISLFLVGGLVAGLMAYDAGGKVNKTTYLIIVLLSKDFPILMTSVIIGGMVPPLVIAFYRIVYKKHKLILEEEPEIAHQFAMGLSFITEGSLQYIKKEAYLRNTLVIASFLAGALTAIFKIPSLVPHGGILASITMNEKAWIFILIVVVIAFVMSQVIALEQYIIRKKEVKEK